MARGGNRGSANGRTESYRHPDADLAARPEVGTQPQFRKKKPPATYRYDSSLAPALDWDGRNGAREIGEWLLACIDEASRLDPPQQFAAPSVFRDADGKMVAECRGLRDAVEKLRRLGRPFLNWAGKAERLSFEVPTLPLFVHERLSTMAIVETLKGHTKAAKAAQLGMFELFGDPQRPVADQVLKAYEYRDEWVNRMILGDSLVVMNSLLNYEGLGDQVQMIYIDPPYGVRFGSNFQPFVRKRDVSHNDDDDMTREPEMVKAYRDTWELGLHSYLTYLRDRFLLCRDLLHETGSLFVQISEENLHHVRSLLDETFGSENLVAVIPFRKKTMPLGTNFVEQMADFIIWYAKQKFDSNGRPFAKYRALYRETSPEPDANYKYIELPDGTRRELTKEEKDNPEAIPTGSRLYRLKSMEPSGPMESGRFNPVFEGKRYGFPTNGYATTPEGMERLITERRVQPLGRLLNYVLFQDDKSGADLTVPWFDTAGARDNDFVVRTSAEVLRRCVLMTTDPGDLVLDPTCGGGTTAYVAEYWGRRWITIDVSRVPLALSRQRLLTATFPFFRLLDEKRGPAGGFRFSEKFDRKGRHIGGLRPYVSLSNIANNDEPEYQIFFDQPDIENGITRVSGPFCVEATIPTPVDWDASETDGDAEAQEYGSYLDRMLDVLRRAPVLQLGGGKTVTLSNIRPPAKSLALSAEALLQNGWEQPVALVFGPENGAVTERSVAEAAREAYGKNHVHLYVIGFAIQANARQLVEQCEAVFGVPATYVQATADLMMGDLLKTMRSSQIFSVCGMPDVALRNVPQAGGQPVQYEVELRGLDVFDPVTMTPAHLRGDDVPAWLLDTDYNGLVFHGSQVFFPRTGAWDNLKKALKATHDESVWDHLAGVVSAPFEPGEHGQVAVKVIDDRGNELIVVDQLPRSV